MNGMIARTLRRPTPAVVLRNQQGRTFEPETVLARVLLYSEGVLLWSCTLSLHNRKKEIVDQAVSAIPEKFLRHIISAQVQPRIGYDGHGPALQIRFDAGPAARRNAG